MCSPGKGFACAYRFVKKLRGYSQPFLVEASDGRLYVLKFGSPLTGPNALFNEVLGTELYRACELPVPCWRLVYLSDEFIERNPVCWLHEPDKDDNGSGMRPPRGLCFASRFLGDRTGGGLTGIIPKGAFLHVRNRSDFWKAWLIDICARHADGRQALFAGDARTTLKAWFIDHGHMFGGPNGDRDPGLEPACYRYFNQRIYGQLSFSDRHMLQTTAETIDFEKLWRRTCTVPSEWKTERAMKAFEACLDRLSDRRVIDQTVEKMVENQLNGGQVSEPNWLPYPRIDWKVLCPRLLSPRKKPRIESAAVDDSAVA